mmetsp:Transcript_22243/g.51988  ORF Transcript_22243/g.51988 Transcript_22243/m.51988 type:complete len:90 (+) Transcript_22243:88-357(+)
MWMLEEEQMRLEQQRTDPVKLAMEELRFKLKFGFFFCLTAPTHPCTGPPWRQGCQRLVLGSHSGQAPAFRRANAEGGPANICIVSLTPR